MDFWTLNGRDSELQFIAERMTDTEPHSAVAHLLPALGTASDPLTLLQRVGAAIAERGKGHRLVVGIDDTHLLDELSVTLVRRLALPRAEMDRLERGYEMGRLRMREEVWYREGRMEPTPWLREGEIVTGGSR